MCALNLRFRVSRLGGARRVCVRISPGFLVIANFCATARAPSVRRASRWPIYCWLGFFRFVQKSQFVQSVMVLKIIPNF